jgi:hypothetical protein
MPLQPGKGGAYGGGRTRPKRETWVVAWSRCSARKPFLRDCKLMTRLLTQRTVCCAPNPPVASPVEPLLFTGQPLFLHRSTTGRDFERYARETKGPLRRSDRLFTGPQRSKIRVIGGRASEQRRKTGVLYNNRQKYGLMMDCFRKGYNALCSDLTGYSRENRRTKRFCIFRRCNLLLPLAVRALANHVLPLAGNRRGGRGTAGMSRRCR